MLTKPGALLGLGVDTAVIGGITYTLLPDGKIVDEEGNPPPPEVTEKITEESTITETIPAPKSDEDIAKERMDMYKNLLGEDEGLTAIESRLGKIEERAQNREDQALNDALIRGGLGMAAGQSQNFLENLAAGATAGIDSYDKSLDDMRGGEMYVVKAPSMKVIDIINSFSNKPKIKIIGLSKPTKIKNLKLQI